MATYLMNPFTGSVDTLENWRANFETCPAEQRQDQGWPGRFEDAELVEVVRNSDGDWVEAE